MTPDEYAFLQQFLQQKSGLVLAEDKQYLVESRLTPIARAAGLNGLSALVACLQEEDRPRLADAIIEAMVTNESFFFRDRKPFLAFSEEMVPALRERRPNKKMRIWSAAAAHGQEPYSLAMLVKEQQQHMPGWSFEICATDISKAAIAKAETGLYSQFEVQRGMPIQMLIDNFDQREEMWQVKPEVRAMVKFAAANLIEDFTQLGSFDVIFCRNVLIYFDQEIRNKVLSNLCKSLAPDGYLVLGAAESIVGTDLDLQPAGNFHGLFQFGASREQSAPTLRAVS